MKILIASVTDSGIYRNRRELIQRLISEGHSVVIAAPRSECSKKLEELGCSFTEVKLKAHGMHIIEELKLIKSFWKILLKEKPDVVLTYTIKPNIYAGILCRLMRIPYIMNITGLGEALIHRGKTQKILIHLYKIATKRVSCIFFQNEYNRQFFIDNKMATGKEFRMLPGSGVNLENFIPIEYPDESSGIRFLFVSRIVKDKGIDELIEAIRKIKERHKNTEFHLVGGCDEEYKPAIEELVKQSLVFYHGKVEDMKSYYGMSHCLLHPSYHEGMANVILESSACGRPSIASNINGCKEAIENNVSGFVFQLKSVDDLIEKIGKFLILSNNEKKRMGLKARAKMEKEFDRNIVINAYMEALYNIKTIPLR